VPIIIALIPISHTPTKYDYMENMMNKTSPERGTSVGDGIFSVYDLSSLDNRTSPEIETISPEIYDKLLNNVLEEQIQDDSDSDTKYKHETQTKRKRTHKKRRE
jgi:hypothetical protein